MIGRIGKQFVQVKKFRVDNLNPLLYNKYKKCKQRGKEHENKEEIEMFLGALSIIMFPIMLEIILALFGK